MDLKDLNDHQKLTLDKFRDLMAGCELPDSSDKYLLKWLIARNFDLIKAQTMLWNSLEWRRKNRADFIREEFHSEVMTKFYATNHIGWDKLGQPLLLSRLCKMDYKGLFKSTTKEEFMKYLIKMNETTTWLGDHSPRPNFKPRPDTIIQSTIIYDMEGLSMYHVTNKAFVDIHIAVVQEYEANYPELMGRIIAINSPKIVSIGYAILRPFLHERTANKIVIFTHDQYEESRKALLAHIDADQLPQCYGGTMTDPDGNPNCVTKCPIGGTVPESYYLSNKKPGTSENDGKIYLHLSAGSKKLVEFHVDSPASILRWEFYSKNGDVAFAVYHHKDDKKMIPIVPPQRINSHASTEKGEIHCQETGKYVADFDNTFSYLRSKELWYSITVEKTLSDETTCFV